jgi:biotin operon repressor
LQFRILKRLLKNQTASRENVARQLGVSEQALMEALKGSRSVAQLKKKLLLEESHQLEQLIEQTRLLYLKRDIEELRHCSSLEEREAKLREVANRMRVSEEELILELYDETRRLRAMKKKSGQ